MTKITINNVNVNKLANEFVSYDVTPKDISSDLIGSEVIAKTATFTFTEDTDMVTVQSILNAHDPAQIPPTPTETDLLKLRLEATEQALLQIMFEGMV